MVHFEGEHFTGLARWLTVPNSTITLWTCPERPVGFYQISTTKKKPNINQIIWNIDHTALYRPNIDRKSSLKSAYLHYLLSSPEINIFWDKHILSPFCHHSGILMKYRPFWCNIDHKFKNIDHLSKMVDYRPMVDNIDPLAALRVQNRK